MDDARTIFYSSTMAGSQLDGPHLSDFRKLEPCAVGPPGGNEQIEK